MNIKRMRGCAVLVLTMLLASCAAQGSVSGTAPESGPIPVDAEAAGALTLAQPDAEVAATAKVEEASAIDEATAGYSEKEIQGRQSALVLANDPMKAGIEDRLAWEVVLSVCVPDSAVMPLGAEDADGTICGTVVVLIDALSGERLASYERYDVDPPSS